MLGSVDGVHRLVVVAFSYVGVRAWAGPDTWSGVVIVGDLRVRDESTLGEVDRRWHNGLGRDGVGLADLCNRLQAGVCLSSLDILDRLSLDDTVCSSISRLGGGCDSDIDRAGRVQSAGDRRSVGVRRIRVVLGLASVDDLLLCAALEVRRGVDSSCQSSVLGWVVLEVVDWLGSSRLSDRVSRNHLGNCDSSRNSSALGRWYCYGGLGAFVDGGGLDDGRLYGFGSGSVGGINAGLNLGVVTSITTVVSDVGIAPLLGLELGDLGVAVGVRLGSGFQGASFDLGGGEGQDDDREEWGEGLHC